jgi:D-glycero-alpha-D-manno-heptose-7-phosphate kinase
VIIARAPFRISFFGGGTDFPEFYREHGGEVLAATIHAYTYISLHRLSPLFTYRFRASYSRTELVQEPAEFQHPLIRECLGMLDVRDGLEIVHVADLPGRTGLGSSSAFTVALLHALHAFRGETVHPEDLAREAIEVERHRVGDVGGHQDQYLAAYGGIVRIEFGPGDRVSVTRLPLRRAAVEELERHILLFYLGREESAQAILNEQVHRTRHNRTALRRLRALVPPAVRALETHDWTAIGQLLHEGWSLKKTLARGISTSEIDDVYAAARRAGALGGKLLGAGGRGFVLVWAPPERHRAIRRALRRLREVHVRLGSEGSRIIFQDDMASS